MTQTDHRASPSVSRQLILAADRDQTMLVGTPPARRRIYDLFCGDGLKLVAVHPVLSMGQDQRVDRTAPMAAIVARPAVTRGAARFERPRADAPTTGQAA